MPYYVRKRYEVWRKPIVWWIVWNDTHTTEMRKLIGNVNDKIWAEAACYVLNQRGQFYAEIREIEYVRWLPPTFWLNRKRKEHILPTIPKRPRPGRPPIVKDEAWKARLRKQTCTVTSRFKQTYYLPLEIPTGKRKKKRKPFKGRKAKLFVNKKRNRTGEWQRRKQVLKNRKEIEDLCYKQESSNTTNNNTSPMTKN